jgi:hypothetical protein
MTTANELKTTKGFPMKRLVKLSIAPAVLLVASLFASTSTAEAGYGYGYGHYGFRSYGYNYYAPTYYYPSYYHVPVYNYHYGWGY